MSKYDGASSTNIARSGGATIALIGADGTGQGNAGTSIACKGCYVQSRAGNNMVKFNVGAAASVVNGVQLLNEEAGGNPLWVPISDVAQLYFYGITGNIIDIVYLVG